MRSPNRLDEIKWSLSLFRGRLNSCCCLGRAILSSCGRLPFKDIRISRRLILWFLFCLAYLVYFFLLIWNMWTTVVCDADAMLLMRDNNCFAGHNDVWWMLLHTLTADAIRQIGKDQQTDRRTNRPSDRQQKHLNFDIKVGNAYSASWLAAGARSIWNARKYSCCRWAWPKVKQERQQQ